MYEPEPAQCSSAQRIPFQCRNKYTSCIPYDHVGNAARSVHEDTYLPVYFRGDFREIPREFRCYEFAVYLSSVNPLDRMKVAGFES